MPKIKVQTQLIEFSAAADIMLDLNLLIQSNLKRNFKGAFSKIKDFKIVE